MIEMTVTINIIGYVTITKDLRVMTIINEDFNDLPHPGVESVNGDVHVFSLTKASQSGQSGIL